MEARDGKNPSYFSWTDAPKASKEDALKKQLEIDTNETYADVVGKLRKRAASPPPSYDLGGSEDDANGAAKAPPKPRAKRLARRIETSDSEDTEPEPMAEPERMVEPGAIPPEPAPVAVVAVEHVVGSPKDVLIHELRVQLREERAAHADRAKAWEQRVETMGGKLMELERDKAAADAATGRLLAEKDAATGRLLVEKDAAHQAQISALEAKYAAAFMSAIRHA